MQTLPIGQYDITKLSDEEIEAKLATAGWGGDHANALIQERQRRQMARLHSEVESLKKPHWTVLPNFWITVVAAIAAIVACYVAWLAWQRPFLPPTPSVSPMSSSTPPRPNATDVFQLRSECAVLGEKLLQNNIVGSDFRQSQVSHYDPKTNRCFVQITVQSADLTKPPDKLDRYLYDGQTAELLAFVGIEKGVKSGMIFKKGILGFEEASTYIDEKMKDD